MKIPYEEKYEEISKLGSGDFPEILFIFTNLLTKSLCLTLWNKNPLLMIIIFFVPFVAYYQLIVNGNLI